MYTYSKPKPTNNCGSKSGDLWMAKSSTSCEGFLQTPLLVVGFVVLIVSLAGFIGACFNVAWALWLYLVVMLVLIGTLLGITIFGFVVTSQGGGVDVPGRVYKEYRLENYSEWLKTRVKDGENWRTIRSCIKGFKHLFEAYFMDSPRLS